jgi:hypothetical protein
MVLVRILMSKFGEYIIKYYSKQGEKIMVLVRILIIVDFAQFY